MNSSYYRDLYYKAAEEIARQKRIGVKMNMTHPDILRAEREGGPSFGVWPSEQMIPQFACICGNTVSADDENTFACEICKQARCYHCRGVYNKDICNDDECMAEHNRQTSSNTLFNC